MNYFSTFKSAEREDGCVSVHLSPASLSFPPVPPELQIFISIEEWQTRLAAITQLARRYSRPLFERVWIFLGFVLTLAVPVVLYRVLADNFIHRGMTDSEALAKFSELRLITFGVFAAVLLVVWAPLIVWKNIGRYRMQSLLREWGQIDVLAKSKGLFVPHWTVDLPSSFSVSAIVRVTIPPRMNPSVFHPDAYLPPYIAPPQYIAGSYGYSQAQGTGAFQDVKI